MHYTELFSQLKSHGFNCGILDDESIVGDKPRIYINGYFGVSIGATAGAGAIVKAYLFADATRRQNNFQNPVSGYGLHVNIDIELPAKDKMQLRQYMKHKIMTDLFEKGFALKPVNSFKVISL